MGRPTEYSVDDVVECFEPCSEPLTAAEVAEMLGCARSTAHEKLTLAVEHGRLRSKKPNPTTRIYWREE